MHFGGNAAGWRGYGTIILLGVVATGTHAETDDRVQTCAVAL